MSTKNGKSKKMSKQDYALKAVALLKDAPNGMSLNEIGKALKYNNPNQRAKIYFGLKSLVVTGGVTYGALRGKEKLFALTGNEIAFPPRKERVKKAAAPKAKRVKKNAEPVATETEAAAATEKAPEAEQPVSTDSAAALNG